MRFSRRAVGMTCALVAAAIVVAVGIGSAQEMAKRFVFGSPGGVSTEANQEIFWKPFTARTGIEIIAEVPSSFGKLRAMVQSGKVTASLWDLGTLQLEQAKALDLIEPIDWDQISPGPMFPEMRQQYGFGQTYFSTVMAWRADVKAPQSWQDFWNVKDFPGKRSLSNFPAYTLPIAALADGVPPDKLYPLDLDRAFRSLDRIKPSVSVWWTTGAQPGQLLVDNEVQYANAWNGRVATLWEQGVRHNFNQGLLDIAWWVVPKGAPPAEKRAAMLFLHEWSDPAKQAEYAKRVYYTGSSPSLAALLPKDKLHMFPTTPENKAKQILANGRWWFENADLVEKRWQAWKLGQ
jgi:putative spermidine/putrescine transport system substrate-binding protein